MRIFKRRAKVLAVLGVAVPVFIFILVFLQGGEIYDYKDTVDKADLPPVDAIVCLAGGRGRILAAGDLWYHYWLRRQSKSGERESPTLPALYFSGVDPQVGWAHLVKQLRNRVSEVLLSDGVVIERESNNTIENAQFLARYAQTHNWRRILLLTSSYHMKRAAFIFDVILDRTQAGVQVETLSVYQDPFSAGSWRKEWNGIRVTLLEYFKWFYYQHVWPKTLGRPDYQK